MKLYSFLSEKKTAVMNRWYDAILNTYPSDTSKFLKGQKNPFMNPVGSTTFHAIESLYEYLVHGEGKDEVPLFLDNIIRIRAVQDFTPAQCVRFILSLKETVREELKDEISVHGLQYELLEFESRIDELSLLAFDIYMKCREKLYQLKATELQRWTYRRLQKADEIYKEECVYKDIHNEVIEFGRKEVDK
ncbi:MAG: RsbRD N-terminal domain-containing protein [Nitrospirae bacterium]|nr:RsbRD N-terminal domain-containing protein [Nitrospirota bacterium]